MTKSGSSRKLAEGSLLTHEKSTQPKRAGVGHGWGRRCPPLGKQAKAFFLLKTRVYASRLCSSGSLAVELLIDA